VAAGDEGEGRTGVGHRRCGAQRLSAGSVAMLS
jgi:hypothetical protein